MSTFSPMQWNAVNWSKLFREPLRHTSEGDKNDSHLTVTQLCAKILTSMSIQFANDTETAWCKKKLVLLARHVKNWNDVQSIRLECQHAFVITLVWCEINETWQIKYVSDAYISKKKKKRFRKQRQNHYLELTVNIIASCCMTTVRLKKISLDTFSCKHIEQNK